MDHLGHQLLPEVGMAYAKEIAKTTNTFSAEHRCNKETAWLVVTFVMAKPSLRLCVTSLTNHIVLKEVVVESMHCRGK